VNVGVQLQKKIKRSMDDDMSGKREAAKTASRDNTTSQNQNFSRMYFLD
jgi:hypothetical protein